MSSLDVECAEEVSSALAFVLELDADGDGADALFERDRDGLVARARVEERLERVAEVHLLRRGDLDECVVAADSEVAVVDGRGLDRRGIVEALTGAVTATARGAGNAAGANADVPAGWGPNRTRPLCICS